MAEWAIQVAGPQSALDHLAQFHTEPPLVVWRDERDDCYLLKCDRFYGLPDDGAVRTVAAQVLTAISGALMEDRVCREPLLAGSVHRRHADGSRDIIWALQGQLMVAMNAYISDPSQPPSAPRSVRLAKLALRDDIVSRTLRFYAREGREWSGLYKIIEAIEEDAGGIVARGWSSEKKLSRFKHSCNSRTVAGDGARHGSEWNQPPKSPMSLREAIAFAHGIHRAWLDLRLRQAEGGLTNAV